MPKLSSKVLFKLDFFHVVFYSCVRYLNVQYHDEIVLEGKLSYVTKNNGDLLKT